MPIFSESGNDKKWRILQEEEGWELPEKAPWPLRLPGVRHIRFIYHAAKVERHYKLYGSLGLFSTGYDDWVLYAIRRGWC